MSELEAIITSIVNGGEIYISDDAHYELKQAARKKERCSSAHATSTRSDLVVWLLSKQIHCRSFGELLHVTDSTPRNLLHMAYARLGVRNRAAAVERARQLGLITPPTTAFDQRLAKAG